ncbi:ABC transporter permease [bacterium D16-51]|nr:ABC transporter permease [bacterium D16-59]RKI59525.1 ABC transporter permease [bacterium D16-51]
MKKVDSREALCRIADKTRKAEKGANVIAILAVSLTTILFTVLFTVSGSMAKKTQEETMRMVGTSSHAELKNLTQEEYDKVKKDKWLRSVSCRIFSGILVNEKLEDLNTEVNYFEEKNAKWSFVYPAEGRMPQKENEVVTSDLVLKKLGAECKVGTVIDLEIEINGKSVKQAFILSGYYKGDVVSMAQMAAVSKAFQEKYAPTPTLSALGRTIDVSDYDGRIAADFNFYTSFGLEKQAGALCKRLGFPEPAGIGVNWAYLGQGDGESAVRFLLLLFLILLSGYFIIYNIFSIRVYKDIAYYGLLKTIGSTGKQLKKIVRRQVYFLAFPGILAGVAAGTLISALLLPYVMKRYNIMEGITCNIELNGWILAGAAAFSFITVCISCNRPCRIVSGITPIEAVQFTEGQPEEILQVKHREKGGIRKKRQKKTKRVSPVAMALQNVQRDRKKRNIVIASLSLALILSNSVYSLMIGFDIDTYISNFTICDYSVQDVSLDDTFAQDRIMDGVSKRFLSALKKQAGIAGLGNIYAREIPPVFSEKQNQIIDKRVFGNEKAVGYIKMYIPPADDGGKGVKEQDYIEKLKETRRFDGTVYGVGQFLAEKLEKVYGKFDWEEFSTGKYVVAARLWDEIEAFRPGETVTLHNEKGEEKEYTVLAVANIPYACGKQWVHEIDFDFILPEKEYLSFFGNSQPMRTLFNVEEGLREKMDKWLEAYCKRSGENLRYTSRKDYEQEFEEYTQMIFIVGNGLVFVLACIGILNFANTVFTSILSRKQEFAMLEAVGMSGKQLQGMLCIEGGYYALCTILISLPAGALANITVIRGLGGEILSYRWKFTIAPVLWCMPALLVLLVIVTILGYRSMVHGSVVERMRRN